MKMRRARSFVALKIAGAFIGNKGVSSNQAVFMRSGEPNAHEICAQHDSGKAFFRSLFSNVFHVEFLSSWIQYLGHPNTQN